MTCSAADELSLVSRHLSISIIVIEMQMAPTRLDAMIGRLKPHS